MSDERSIDDLLNDGYRLTPGEWLNDEERVLAQAATVLLRRGARLSTALLLDVKRLEWEAKPAEYAPDWADSIAVLYVEPHRLEQFTEERLSEITEAIRIASNGFGGGVAWTYVREAPPDVGPEWRAPLAQALKGGRAMIEQRATPDHSRIWRTGEVRLFVSHLALYKRVASDVSAELESLRIHGFVAHEDIEVSREWQAEIEAALETMDAFVGLVHRGFSASFWTQQEIGWALGRQVPVLMVRLGEDPRGFPGRWQATAPGEDASEIASSIAMWLTQHDRVGPAVLDSLVDELVNAGSYVDAKQAALRFEEIGRLPAAVLDRLAGAYYTNNQLYPHHIGAVVLERIFARHHRGWPPDRPN